MVLAQAESKQHIRFNLSAQTITNEYFFITTDTDLQENREVFSPHFIFMA